MFAFPAGRPFDAEAAVARAAQNVAALGPAFCSAGRKFEEAGAAANSELDTGGPLRVGFCHGDVWLQAKAIHEKAPFGSLNHCSLKLGILNLNRPRARLL
jgi:hypothetical protein